MEVHLRIKKGDISKYCIIAGDPGRVERIAGLLKNSKKVSENRGYNVFNGYYDGVLISVASCGIGGPSAGIVVQELINAGAEVIIRVGSGGVLRKDINTGDLVISTGVCKEEKSSLAFAEAGFAAVPDFIVLKSLIDSAREFGKKFFYGVTMCCDGFYAESHRERMVEWSKKNVIGSDMESSMLFTLCTINGVRAGFIFYGGLNVLRKQTHKDILKQSELRSAGERNAIMVAFNAIKKIKEVKNG